MRIDDLNRTPLAQGPEQAEAANPRQALEHEGAVASRTDQADVSELAKALKAGDPSRIERLRLEVRSGKYDVAADVVAKAIIDAHLDS